MHLKYILNDFPKPSLLTNVCRKFKSMSRKHTHTHTHCKINQRELVCECIVACVNNLPLGISILSIKEARIRQLILHLCCCWPASVAGLLSWCRRTDALYCRPPQHYLTAGFWRKWEWPSHSQEEGNREAICHVHDRPFTLLAQISVALAYTVYTALTEVL